MNQSLRTDVTAQDGILNRLLCALSHSHRLYGGQEGKVVVGRVDISSYYMILGIFCI